MYQKYIFKITGNNIISNKEVLIRNLTQNPEKLDIKNGKAEIDDKTLDINIIYENSSKKPTGIITVSSEDVESLEHFDSIITEITKNEHKFNEFRCIFDGVSSYYSKKIYSKLHDIERKTQEFLKELFYISDESGKLDKFQTTLKNMEKNDFTFSKLIKEIFDRGDITEEFIDHIKYCIEEQSVPSSTLFPKSFWDSSLLTGSQKEGTEINELLEEIRKTRNTIAHCKKFSQKEYENCKLKVDELNDKLEEVISSIENESISDRRNTEPLIGEAERISNSLQSEDSEIKRAYFKEYQQLKKDRQVINLIDFSNDDFDSHVEFYAHLNEKTDEEIINETKILEQKNSIDIGIPKEEMSEDDLTIIVPAQKEGFEQVFLKDNEWYDIRIGKNRRSKIKYIAGYEIKPRSGIQYIAKVKKIIPSENAFGYWKVIFDGEPRKYDRLIHLGNTYPPQNIRYTTKRELDEVAENNETLEKIFNNPY